MADIRARVQHELALCEKAIRILSALPPESYGDHSASITGGTLMLYGLTRQQTLQVINSAAAGRWEKRVNPSYPDRIDYITSIDGMPVEIYATQPPDSCRIEIIEEEIPAHTVMRRKLVCK